MSPQPTVAGIVKNKIPILADTTSLYDMMQFGVMCKSQLNWRETIFNEYNMISEM